jgi:hypothetical protein
VPYPNEHACRLVDPDKVNVVGSGEREHDDKKYRVIFGKPKGGDGSVEQAYRYPVDGWSEPEARAHCRAHDGILFEPAAGREAGVELRFWAAVHSIETGEERRLATFYIMNTSLNRNRWRVTDEALEEACPALMGKALNCIPGYRVDHVHEPQQVGRWVKVDKPNGYVLATAEITNDVAWEKLSSGEWGPVSVVIRAFRVACSVCGADVTASPDDHIKSGEGHEVIESFAFTRVDFVAEPAYPQAGLLTMGRLAELTTPEVMVLYSSRSAMDGPQGARGNPNPEEEEGKRMDELAEVKQQLEQVKAENTSLKTANEQIKGRVKALEDERHQERVDAALEARFKADLVKDRQAEATRLKEHDDRTLDLLREDAEKVAEKMAKAPPTGPKTKFTKDDKSAFEAAVESKREELFGYKRDASGKVVS